jgi:hypothetical protein
MSARALLRLVLVLGMCTTAVTARAGIDLEVTDVHVVWGGPHVYLQAEVTVAASGYHDGYLVDVGYELDGVLVGTAQFDLGQIDHSGGPAPRCVDSVSPCDGWCPPVVIDGQVVTAYACWDWPSDTDCCCIYLVMTTPSEPLQYNGETTATATIDYSNTVAETDETNNSMSVALERPGIDFSVTGCGVSWTMDGFVIEAEISTHVQGEHSGFVTDVGFYVDGVFHSSVVFDGGPFGPNPDIKCEDTYPACDGLCAPAIINDQIVSGSCGSWLYTDSCSCVYLVLKNPGPIAYNDQVSCTIVADDGGNVAEANEENNSYECMIAGSPVEGTTWSTIKSLYR